MEPPSRYSVAIVNRSGVAAPAALIRTGVRAALSQASALSGKVAVLLTDDAEIQSLNRDFRQLDEPTDVLSFPAGVDTWQGADRKFLGDIAISVPFARRQADLRNVELRVELSYLAIHGTLHLLGHDDESEPARTKMLKAMNRAGKAAGLPEDPAWSSILHTIGATA